MIAQRKAERLPRRSAKSPVAASSSATPADIRTDVRRGIAAYYSRKIQTYGATPLGVDWRCVPTQELRFAQLLRLCDFTRRFSLNDVGCGYGALVAYLEEKHSGVEVDYLGIDLSRAMISRAQGLWQRHGHAKFVCGDRSPRVADYSVASGIFNVKLAQPIAVWEAFVAETLTEMHTASSVGSAVNFMAPASPDEPAVPELYRVQPVRWIDFCERQLGASVELIDDYGLGEFTLLVRRS